MKAPTAPRKIEIRLVDDTGHSRRFTWIGTNLVLATLHAITKLEAMGRRIAYNRPVVATDLVNGRWQAWG